MCKFLYKEIYNKAAFAPFFQCGNNFDSSFTYELSFGFLPRHYLDTPEDRYIIEEESDVTEITFVDNGTWGVCFDCHE